jgi:hypothetical protein
VNFKVHGQAPHFKGIVTLDCAPSAALSFSGEEGLSPGLADRRMSTSLRRLEAEVTELIIGSRLRSEKRAAWRFNRAGLTKQVCWPGSRRAPEPWRYGAGGA